MSVATIALGSNIDNPRRQATQAITEIAALEYVEIKAVSSLYESIPQGPQLQPNFINAVMQCETTLTPRQLLRRLQEIEQKHHRLKTVRWGPRTLDCDILLYGEDAIQSRHLTIPHPQLEKRDFVLKPLLEIAPELILPSGNSVAVALKRCDDCFVLKSSNSC